MWTLTIAILMVVMVAADDLTECKCSAGYVPEKDEGGEVNCRGTTIKSILPCNLILTPDCQCNKEATTVVQDSTGTWCGKIVDGRTTGKWPCQNKDDWENFYKQHPEEKP